MGGQGENSLASRRNIVVALFHSKAMDSCEEWVKQMGRMTDSVAPKYRTTNRQSIEIANENTSALPQVLFWAIGAISGRLRSEFGFIIRY